MNTRRQYILIGFIIFFLLIIGYRVQGEETGSHGKLITRATYDGTFSTLFEFLPSWITNLDDTNEYIMWTFPMTIETNYNEIWTEPSVELVLFDHVLTLGTSFPLGVDIIETDEGDNAEFFAKEKIWLSIGFFQDDFFFRVQPNYILDFTNWPEQSTDIFGEMAFRHKKKDWKLQVGTDCRWIDTFNGEEDYQHGQIIWDVRAQFQMRKGIKPLFAIEHRMEWDDQEGTYAYDMLMDRLMRWEIGVFPGDFSIYLYGDIVLDEPEINEPWSAGVQMNIKLY